MTDTTPAPLSTPGTAPRPARSPLELVERVTRVLFEKHPPASHDEYGKCHTAGCVVRAISAGARITHRTPEPDLTDPERPSDDEAAAERSRMVAAYAHTLTAAGYQVVPRARTSRHPFLLISCATPNGA